MGLKGSLTALGTPGPPREDGTEPRLKDGQKWGKSEARRMGGGGITWAGKGREECDSDSEHFRKLHGAERPPVRDLVAQMMAFTYPEAGAGAEALKGLTPGSHIVWVSSLTHPDWSRGIEPATKVHAVDRALNL